MSTPLKIGVSIVSILVVLAVALTILVKTQVTPERVRGVLLPLIEKSLERDVDFGEISIGLFSGISVSDLEVMQKNVEREFFSVQAVEFHYQFWPLLTGKVVVDQVLLDQPRIYLTRLPDGQFNFSDLLPRPAVADQAAVADDNSSQPSAPSSAFNLLVKEINLKSGELEYVDKYRNARSPFRYTLNKLNINARQMTLDKSFPIDLSAVINGSNIDISGNYDFSRKTGDLIIQLASLDLVQFAPYYRDRFPGKIASAQLALNLEVDLEPEFISSKGNISLEDVDLTLDEYPEVDLKKAKSGADYSLTYSSDQQLLDVSTLLFSFNDLNLGAEGEFDLSTSDPYLVLTLLVKQLDLRDVMQNIPEGLTRDFQKYSVAGLIDGQIDLSGRLSRGINLVKSVDLSLTDVRASAENLRAGVSGDIAYADKTLQTEDLLLQYGDQQAQLQVEAELTIDQMVQGDFILSAETLDLNKILSQPNDRPESPIEADNGALKTGQSKTLADDIGPFEIPVDMSGRLAIDRLIYKELLIDKVTADISLKDNHLAIYNLTSQIGDGALRASSHINLGVQGLAYQGQVAIEQPNIMTLVSGLIPGSQQAISGQLEWQNSFAGKGTIADNCLQALQLKGEIALQNGEVRGVPALESLAVFLGNSDLEVLSFQSLTGQYDLHDGLTRIDSHLESSKTRLTTTGTIDIGGRLNLQLDARLAPEIMDKLGESQSLKQTISDQDGWGKLPLQVQGSLNHPQIGYDSTALQQQMVEKAREKATEKLLEKIDPAAAEPMQQLLDKTFNKLFGN